MHPGALLLTAALAAAGSPPGAEATPAAPVLHVPAAALQQVPDTLVEFDFREADLGLVLTALADAADLSLVYSNLPDTPVTLRTARPVSRAAVMAFLQNIADVNGLRLTEQDGTLIVTPDPRARPGEPGEETPAFRPDIRLFVQPLDHASADAVVPMLQTLFGLRRDAPFAATEDLALSLSESLRQQVTQGYETMEPDDPFAQQQQPVEQTFGRAEDAALASVLEGPVKLVPDIRNNAVLVLSTEADFETIEQAIVQIDIRPLQVLIEVTVVEVRRDENFDAGVGVTVPPDEEGEGVSFTQEGISASDTPGEVALQVLGIGDRGADVVLRALATTSATRILSRPAVLAQNNYSSRILSGEERPFTQLTRALPTDQSIQDRVIQYQPVGTELFVTPIINRDGFVNLHVLQQVSSATAEVQFGAPVIDTREAETRVLVRDGHTVVLGGLVDRQEQEIRSGIPFLKDIPLLGYLFGRTTTMELATELFILITPRVIRTEKDLDEATEVIRQREGLEEELQRAAPIIPRPDTLLVPEIRRSSPDSTRGGGGGGADSAPRADEVSGA